MEHALEKHDDVTRAVVVETESRPRKLLVACIE